MDMMPQVYFAQFRDGNLTTFLASPTELDYFAISHVWGKTEWLEISGIAGEKLASREKANFIQHELPDLVGDVPFWMDTLTVNQRDQAEVISTVQAIPTIFRHARRTIAIREADGFFDCCMNAIKGCKGWEEIYNVMFAHNSEVHLNHLRYESYLKRLWTLQECLLSTEIKFVVPRQNEPRNATKNLHQSVFDHNLHWRGIMDSLFVLASSFADVADNIEIQQDSFIEAYLSCGTIAKQTATNRTNAEDIHTGKFRRVNFMSSRAATKPRDYIFATMPQFPWYHYPKNAVGMSFPQIFHDLYTQAANSGHAFVTRFTRSMTEASATDDPVEAWQPSKILPEPTCLGDFLKLIGARSPIEASASAPNIHLTTTVQIKEFENEPAEVVLAILESAINFSAAQWAESHIGEELSRFGNSPDSSWTLDQWDALTSGWIHRGMPHEARVIELENENIVAMGPGLEYEEQRTISAEAVNASLEPNESLERVTLFQQARKILDLMWCSLDEVSIDTSIREKWHYFKQSMQGMWSRPLLRTLMLLAAMISCQISLSADVWANQLFVPVFLRFGDSTLLGLLARHARMDEKSRVREMLSVGQHLPGTDGYGTDLVLVDFTHMSPVGILPAFHAFNVSDDDFVKRALMLYSGFVELAADRKVMTEVVTLAEVGFRVRESPRNLA